MSDKLPIAILGAGKIGRAIARYLHTSGHYDVLLGDHVQAALDSVHSETPVATQRVEVSDTSALAGFLKGRRAVISACSFDLTPPIAMAASEAGCSYFDLTEDVAATRFVRDAASKSKEGQIFMPQCGLAPGFISVLAADLCRQFDELHTVKMRVGALPLYPTNMLKYNLTWSTDGLINEYCNPCEAIRGGRKIDLQPMEGLERFALDGVDYEAFNTSGGLGTLCETLEGKVTDLDYKTVRYVGHHYLMTFLLHGLHFERRRGLLKELMEESIPTTVQDLTLAFCTVTGRRNGRLEQAAIARKVYHGAIAGVPASSIQITTASSLCVAVDLWRLGKLPPTGFVRQEDIRLADFLANEFGEPFALATDVTTPISVKDAPEPIA
ncbi:saccharopine dehydrogenase C-terminal domain-containing protein [Botrimarina sp.]|uniref:saccharopine dehydrogenase family protein n=1 Tax=Botrimarina sp. TaxID=2795802 RepID=UPI0032EFFEAA